MFDSLLQITYQIKSNRFKSELKKRKYQAKSNEIAKKKSNTQISTYHPALLSSSLEFFTRSSKTESDIKSNCSKSDSKKVNIKPNQMKLEKI